MSCSTKVALRSGFGQAGRCREHSVLLKAPGFEKCGLRAGGLIVESVREKNADLRSKLTVIRLINARDHVK
jgi:hypothetical protein